MVYDVATQFGIKPYFFINSKKKCGYELSFRVLFAKNETVNLKVFYCYFVAFSIS